MENNWESFKKLVNYKNGGIFSKVLKKNYNINITLFCLSAKAEISEHTTTKNGFIYIIEGNGIFNLAGKNIKMLPGIIIYMNKNTVHYIKAQNNTSFLLFLYN